MIANRYSGRYGQRAALCVAFLVLGSQAGVAGDDHDRARQALEAGEVLPLRSILERVERDYPGQVLDVEPVSYTHLDVYKRQLQSLGYRESLPHHGHARLRG